jgi:octaprenyl-diphosphate synthase
LILSVEHEDYNLLQIISNTIREMSEGELTQLAKARRLDITEDVYFEIIRKKTASLIASCCAMGARSVKAPEEVVEKMRVFGEKVGLAFQIKDDLFDFGDAEVGKPLGIDIKEKKMTLPLIFALKQASWFQRRHIINLIKNHSEKPQKVAEVIQFVRDSGGIQYATEAMNKLVEEARHILLSFPNSPYRTSLEGLVQFTIERSK